MRPSFLDRSLRPAARACCGTETDGQWQRSIISLAVQPSLRVSNSATAAVLVPGRDPFDLPPARGLLLAALAAGRAGRFDLAFFDTTDSFDVVSLSFAPEDFSWVGDA